jgi:hypothetical protein
MVARQVAKSLDYSPRKSDRVLNLGDRTLLGFDMSEAAERYGVPSDVIPKRIRISADGPVYA